MHKMINRLLTLLMGLVLLPVVLLGSCSFAPYRVAGTPSSGASGTNAVYVVSHGWHTGLIVPAEPCLPCKRALAMPLITKSSGVTRAFTKPPK